jgi:hypothetical protein
LLIPLASVSLPLLHYLRSDLRRDRRFQFFNAKNAITAVATGARLRRASRFPS